MPDLPLFLVALAIVYAVPGPDMVLVMRTGATARPGPLAATVCGLAAARATHVLLSAAGLAAVLRASPLAFETLRLAGAAYLIWLGIGLARAGRLRIDVADGPTATSGVGPAFQRGLLTNILNPKALIFCSMLLPQFVVPTGAVAPQFALLGAVLVGTGALFDTVFGLAGRRIGALFSRHPRAEAAEGWLFGGLMIAFGLKVAALPG